MDDGRITLIKGEDFNFLYARQNWRFYVSVKGIITIRSLLDQEELWKRAFASYSEACQYSFQLQKDVAAFLQSINFEVLLMEHLL